VKTRASALGVAVVVLSAMVGSVSQADAAASQCGKASWYKMGTRTASGERMNASALAAAHRSLPFGTKVRVKSASTGRSVVVTIVDRGPFIKGRVIDLSKGAASALGFSGLHKVHLAVLGKDGSGKKVKTAQNDK
jgi:rare lipoprotein A